MPEQKEEQKVLNIIRPPGFIYRFQDLYGIAGTDRTNPSREVVPQGQGTFDFVGVKYPAMYHKPDEFYASTGLKREMFKYPVSFVSQGTQTFIYSHTDYPWPLTEEEEKMGGQLSCFKDVPYPYKGHPSPEPIYAINASKRLSRDGLEFLAHKDLKWCFLGFLLTRKKHKLSIIARFMEKYSDACLKTSLPYIIAPEYMTKYGKEIELFITRLFVKIGINKNTSAQFAMVFAAQIDYDNAYWMKLGDTMAETSKEAMMKNPRKELFKLAGIINQRELYKGNAERFTSAIKAVSYILLIPKYKRIFRECVEESTFENLQFDDADRYHTLVYNDYNYQGKTVEERLRIWKEWHDKNGTPLPLRMTVHPT